MLTGRCAEGSARSSPRRTCSRARGARIVARQGHCYVNSAIMKGTQARDAIPLLFDKPLRRRCPTAFMFSASSGGERPLVSAHKETRMAQEVVAIAKKHVVYTLPGTDVVRVESGVYREHQSTPLVFDAYYPAASAPGALLPVVILVTGFPDGGAKQRLGCHFKDMGAFVSWARLIAASGCVAINYVNAQPEMDLLALLTHVRENAERLHVDRRRLGLWSCSGHAPNALSVMMRSTRGDGLTCAALCYPYTMDDGDATHVARASRQMGFVDACAGKAVADLPSHVPLFIARAGGDEMPGLNVALDRFVSAALAANLPLTLVNHSTAPHAFDLFDDSAMTRDVIKQILDFISTGTGLTRSTPPKTTLETR